VRSHLENQLRFSATFFERSLEKGVVSNKKYFYIFSKILCSAGILPAFEFNIICRLEACATSYSDLFGLGRMMKLVTQGDIVELTGIIHRFMGQVWKRLVRSGHKLRSALSDMWIDVDSTVEGVYGNQKGADVGYNPRKKWQKSYHPVIAFVAETKEILHSWFRCGSAYTSNGIVEFMKECMVYMKKRVRVIFRGDSGFFRESCWITLSQCQRDTLSR
jgi:hypothetical protein